MWRARALRALCEGNYYVQQMQNIPSFCALHTSIAAMATRNADNAVKTANSSQVTKGVPASERIAMETPRGALPPLPPDNCCMSGCANCVWLQHAEELLEHYKDGGDKALEAIDQIQDPSLKMFLKMELKALRR
ncbi:OXLD1 [Branchiostoma lanceolatum]|uniref:OXLD1 protein n=1 Tax=Branchiostoma lanceolatum TaxID=7740 RepID=A0A8K0F3G5_BRALA|nr:OXLD1 [Branchiostoma lanceolatum]